MKKEATLNIERHADAGSIKLTLQQQFDNQTAKSLVENVMSRISGAIQSGDPRAQLFEEEGPVFLSVESRPDINHGGDGHKGTECSYMMNFLDSAKSGSFARMHTHLGERLLRITTNPEASFSIWSLTPIEIDNEMKELPGISREETTDKLSGRKIYGVHTPPSIQFAAHFPKNTSHQFVLEGGHTIATSDHPHELSELLITGMGSNMEGQTKYFHEAGTPLSDCPGLEIVTETLNFCDIVTKKEYLNAEGMAKFIKKEFNTNIAPSDVQEVIKRWYHDDLIENHQNQNLKSNPTQEKLFENLDSYRATPIKENNFADGKKRYLTYVPKGAASAIMKIALEKKSQEFSRY